MANASLKTALHADADACGVPRKALADLIGISGAALYAALDEQQPNSHLSLQRFLTFVHVTGGHHALDYLAGLVGAVVYRLPRSTGRIEQQTAATVREFGELLETLGRAHADGCISDPEAADVAREGREAIAAIAALIADVEQRARPASLRAVGSAR